MAPRRQTPQDLTGIRQRGNRYQVRIFGGTGRQLILTGSAKTKADAIAVRDGFRAQLDTQTAVRTNVTAAVLLAEWVPVFLRRTCPVAEGVPAALRSLLSEDGSCLVREGSLGRDAEALTARVVAFDGAPSLRAPSGDVPVGNDLGPDTVRTGVDAMLRHVVPYAQQRMKNRDLLARTAVDVLGPGDWLRHVSAGRSPGRDSGSGVVVLTETAVTVANLNSRCAIADKDSVLLEGGGRGLAEVAVRRRKRLGALPVADLRLRRADGTHLDVLGLFEGAADDLLENLPVGVSQRKSR